VAAALDETSLRDTIWTLAAILVMGIPFAAGLAIAGGYFLAGRVLSPVGAMARKAREITAESLAKRLPVDNSQDEFGRLATVFNDTLARLQDAFERLRRFTADASHELRTPLTAMRSVGEVALQNTLDAVAYRDVIGSMLEEVDRLTRLVESLLMLTRADSGRVQLAPEALDLGPLVGHVMEQLRVLADEKQQALTLRAPIRIHALADAALIRHALMNLIHNAIKYTSNGGAITVEVKSTGGQAIIEVRDTGPGIPAAHRDRIFDRFYRVDTGRSREEGGVGLGLAIARWAVEANGGQIELAGDVADGSLFRVILRAPDHSTGADGDRQLRCELRKDRQEVESS
jgi:heavy metal sensor kinase